MNKITKLILITIGAIILLVGNYFLMAEVLFGPSSEVKAALKSDAIIEVSFREGKNWLVYSPLQQSVKAGLVLYPENYQDIRMYAPICQRVARAGYMVVMLSRREKFAPTLPEEEQRVAAVRAAFPKVQKWFIGAHTWEANLAAAYANLHPQEVTGVVLWAGRLNPQNSLAQTTLPVLEVYGTLDDQNENLIAANRLFLPAQTVFAAIEGGNRVNFANFGPMPRDVGAAIPIQEQQAQAAAATIEFLNQVLNPDV